MLDERKRILCPVCNRYTFAYEDDYDICPICGWENDSIQNMNPDFKGGANPMSLNEAKAEFASTGKRIDKQSYSQSH